MVFVKPIPLTSGEVGGGSFRLGRSGISPLEDQYSQSFKYPKKHVFLVFETLIFTRGFTFFSKSKTIPHYLPTFYGISLH